MQKQPNSRTCFLCGRENDISLKLKWYNDDENKKVIGKVTIPERFNSYPGIVHGGVVAAILDETAGRSIMLNGDFDNFMVTAKIEVEYKAPTPCNEELAVSGWIIKKSKAWAKVAGEIRKADGTITAACEAIIVQPPKETLSRWYEEKEFWYVD